MLRWRELVHLSDEQLAAFDVAEVNLACAEGLPGAETIDHAECLNRLNHFAWCSSHSTERRLNIFCAQPAAYNHSEALFRIIRMMTLLWRQLGIRYNPAKIAVNVPMDTADTFVHGALVGAGGTCATCEVPHLTKSVFLTSENCRDWTLVRPQRLGRSGGKKREKNWTSTRISEKRGSL